MIWKCAKMAVLFFLNLFKSFFLSFGEGGGLFSNAFFSWFFII